MARILIIDDEEPIRFSLRGILEDEGYEVLEAATAEEGLEVADAERPDLVFLDIWLPGMDGLTAQARLKGNHPDLPVVMISGHGTIKTAVSAIQQGAYDFIEKPLSLEKVVIVAARALEAGSLRRENQVLRTVLPEQDELIGQSPVMLKFQELLARVAPTDVWVLLTGENGTGKELAARALHAGSRRADAPMIAVNCAAIPEELIESELFGHEKGAFTSADQARAGRFEMANNGTLFLDEIGELPLRLQSKLLQVIQEKQIVKLGGVKPVSIDFRLVAATNQDLEALVEKKRFRSDLFFRLNVLPLWIPPLRERREEIVPLCLSILGEMNAKYGTEKVFSDEVKRHLAAYSWPGNIRELRNVIERLVIVSSGGVIKADELPEHMFRHQENPESPIGKSLPDALETLERRMILEAYKACGTTTGVAKALGISQPTAARKIAKYKNEASGER